MSNLVDVDNLSFGYTRRTKVLAGVSLAIEAGAFIAVAGPNGAGKSTFISLLAGILRPESGRIRIDGRDIGSYSTRTLATRIAIVRQQFTPVFDFSVAETVMMARTPYFGTGGFESEVDRNIATQAMEATDTARFANRPLRSLSSGERQRVMIARALAQQTPIILLDEPTSSLDLRHQVAIYDLLKATQRDKGVTIVFVTHDLNLVGQYCDQVLLLAPPDASSAGATSTEPNYYVGPAAQVLRRDRLERVFGIELIQAQIGRQNLFLPVGKLDRNHPPS